MRSTITKGTCDGKNGKYPHCGSADVFIVIKSRGQCGFCNNRFKKNKKIALKSGIVRKKPRATGEYRLFEEIAMEREHKCAVTGAPVRVRKSDGTLDVWCFAHVLAKKVYGRFRLEKKNILILDPIVHQVYDRGNAQERKAMERFEGWCKLLALRDELKSEYSKLPHI